MPRRLNTERDTIEFPSRNPLGGADEETLRRVRSILGEVRRHGWEAVVDQSLEYDGCRPASSACTPPELRTAWDALPAEVREALELSRQRIARYQRAISTRSTVVTDPAGGLIGDVVRPLSRVGCYIPGGRVPLPSTVLMTAYIARVAGVEEIVICSPSRENNDGYPHPAVMAAAHLIREAEVYGVGGVQAIGALCYGAGPIDGVDLICGPGNLFVTLAKKEVYGEVDVDMLAGPSEIAVIAQSDSTRPEYVAADLLSQAEHDPQSRVFLLTPDRMLITMVDEALEEQVQEHPREESVRLALENSALIETLDLTEAVDLSNELAPEHLELHVPDPTAVARDCVNAGAVFCGPYSPEPVGDYVAGPSHTLPTGGSARFFSPLSVQTFLKHQSLIALDREGFREVGPAAEQLAQLESLPAHGESVRIRS